MKSNELRKKYIEFFKSKLHTEIKSASLIPENDPTVLFTTAGMHPLVPYLLGEKHPSGTRLVDAQKCIRTGDIEDVGDNRHLTFFEMLGNWSLGDYFKKEAINWSFEFLTDKNIGLGLDPSRLYFTVFKGENGIPRDEEAIETWKEVLSKNNLPNGVSEDESVHDDIKIIPLGVGDNFWIAGATGPCGGDTEIFYDTRPEEGKLEGRFEDLINSFRVIEIWNNVFMEFNKTEEGKYEKLAKQNVDTGMGLERTITVLSNVPTVFETDSFENAIKKLEEISGKKYSENLKPFRVIIDHVKTSTFILADDKGIVPGNKDQGYVLRRLIRRAVRFGKQLGISDETIFTSEISKVYVEQYKEFYPELGRNEVKVLEELKKEEIKFKETLENGEKELLKLFNSIYLFNNEYENQENKINKYRINGIDLFNLYQSFGFPIEISLEEIENKIELLLQDNENNSFNLKNLSVDRNEIIKEFNEELKKHQELSKQGAEQKFKGGLADSDPRTVQLHTAAHLMLESMRRIIGPHISQKGANITSERLRFDIASPDKFTEEQLRAVEVMVNEQIQAKLPVHFEEMSVEEADKIGATGVFKDRYGEVVKVYFMGDFSKEICGGPHVDNTSELGHFKITKEESSSAGVRRIKAILE